MKSITIGVFDGVHKGHRNVLEALRSLSEKYDSVPKVYSILYPLEYYQDPNFKGLILPSHERLNLLNKFAGIIENKKYRSNGILQPGFQRS